MGLVSSVDPAAAGWYPDPHGRHEERWWDPPRWTDDVRDGGTRGTDPVAPAPASPTVSAAAVGPGGDPRVLDLESFVVAMPEVGGGTWQRTLPVHGPEGDGTVGWVHFAKEKHGLYGGSATAFLLDPSGVPLVGARRTTSRGPGGRNAARHGHRAGGTGPFHAFEILDAQGSGVTTSRHTQVLDRHRIRFSQQRVEVVQLELSLRGRHQVPPTTITVGGTVLGSVVQLGERATVGPAGSWLRLDRAPGLGDPHRTFVAAAPLVLLTYIT